jgi:tetratricopeptide (TPR) repeat protein
LVLCLHLYWIWGFVATSDEITGRLDAVIRQAGARESTDLGRCLVPWGADLALRGDYDRARRAVTRAIPLLRAARDKLLPIAWTILGQIESDLGQTEAARYAFAQAMTLARQSGYVAGVADVLRTEAEVELSMEQFDRAIELGRQAEELLSQIGADREEAYARATVAVAIQRLGRAAESHKMMSQSVRQLIAYRGDQFDLAGLAEDYGAVLFALGYSELVPMLFAAATAARQRDGLPRDQAHQSAVDETSTSVQAVMSTEHWQRAYRRGRGMKLEDALSEAVSATNGD